MSGNPIVIERDKVQPASLVYEELLKEAIHRVQELSGGIWTDYNLHDPGVTILEQLCYAITDPAYRTAFSIEDILAGKNGKIDAAQHAFFSKADILTTAPVTMKDYRKLLLDQVEGIENVWVEPLQTGISPGTAKGVYRIYIQVEDTLAADMKANNETVAQAKQAVHDCMMAYRNIGEDVDDIIVLQPQEIFIKAEIFVDSKHDAQQIMAHVCNAFELVLHPPVRFLSAGEMAVNGYPVEEIYAGPLLSKGFVMDSDLRERKRIVDPAELMKAASEVPGVIKVKSVYVAGEDGQFAPRPIAIQPDHYPYLQMINDRHDVKVSSDKYEYHSKDATFWNAYQKIKTVSRRKYAGHRNNEVLRELQGTWRNIGRYYSLQHHFPYIYGIGRDGLESNASPARRAKAKQLKAYLLFFEQVLANYLAQLAGIGHFFSPDLQHTPPYTYAAQPLYNVPHVRHLLKAYPQHPGQSWDDFMADTGNDYMKKIMDGIETDKIYQERKNHILDHLLARFNIVLLKYPVTFYQHVYGDPDAEMPRVDATLQWKAGILQQLPALTANRNRSFNYHHAFSGAVLCGYEKQLYQLLHIGGGKRKRLTTIFDEGKWKVEISDKAQHVKVKFIKEFRLKDEILKVSIAESDARFDYGIQSVSLLRFGLDRSHYRIVYDDDSRQMLIIYRHTSHEFWRVVGRASTPADAQQLLSELIGHLRDISLESEGFYTVEHLLLRPPHTAAHYGFRITGRKNQVLLQHARWQQYQDRTALLQQLPDRAKQLLGVDAVEAFRQLQTDFIIYLYKENVPTVVTAAHFAHPDWKDKAANSMTDLLLHLTQLFRPDQRYPRVEYYVDHTSGHMLQEEFFRFGLTFIFPSWPARFQFTEFRHFTEQLIRENTPVHCRLRYHWIGISSMRTFESHYFRWLTALRENKKEHDHHALINLLAAPGMVIPELLTGP